MVDSSKVTSTDIEVWSPEVPPPPDDIPDEAAITEEDTGPSHRRAEGQSVDRRPFVLVVAGEREGELFALEPGVRLVVGRGDQCDIRILSESVSRRHCALTLGDDGLEVEDLGSQNGTLVGATRVTRALLAPDEVVRLGATSVLKYALISEVEEQYRRQMLQAVLVDPLTLAFNRRHFEDRLAAECAVADRHHRPLVLLLVDVDDFKQINDRYGHPTGDLVLRQIGEALQGSLRTEDLLFRFGGEEFALLARETALDGGVRLAERLRERVAALRIPLEAGKDEIRVTVSVGVALFRPGDRSELVARADTALYQAKRQGKNQVVAEEEAPEDEGADR